MSACGSGRLGVNVRVLSDSYPGMGWSLENVVVEVGAVKEMVVDESGVPDKK